MLAEKQLPVICMLDQSRESVQADKELKPASALQQYEHIDLLVINGDLTGFIPASDTFAINSCHQCRDIALCGVASLMAAVQCRCS